MIIDPLNNWELKVPLLKKKNDFWAGPRIHFRVSQLVRVKEEKRRRKHSKGRPSCIYRKRKAEEEQWMRRPFGGSADGDGMRR